MVTGALQLVYRDSGCFKNEYWRESKVCQVRIRIRIVSEHQERCSIPLIRGFLIILNLFFCDIFVQ